ncbi:ribosome modulation factor [Marinibactrum halimedae]|uniref:Ribosome modulation factor n=1 Tax=Marinibactrum halimedae TaxID=1444977 RepID=A0AA37T643_9GAMM|nr:ribosome modulation factor [Marinibactrum halimedae]MCD9459241.1 ribosome modulation factor [Marinibactrum halimedae]GLS27314.1 ribosome modulation factor [Marinibactrum halimedae]
MKRQKRNPSDRAFSRGYRAGFEGRSRSQCPYETSTIRYEWLHGWREGREDQWNGFDSRASLQRLSNR